MSSPTVPVTDAEIDAAFRVKGVVELQKDYGSDRIKIVKKEPHVMSLLLNLILLASRMFLLIVWIGWNNNPIKWRDQYNIIQKYYYIFIVVEAAYLLELFCSSTLRYLCNQASSHSVRGHIIRMKETRPSFSMWCECYHYETRVRYVTETYTENGETKTREVRETYEEKVVTHTETDYFEFSHFIETSQMISDDIYYNDMIKIRLKYSISFGDEHTRAAYNRHLQRFISRNKHRDVHFSYTESQSIPGFLDKLFSRNGEKQSMLINWGWYLLTSLLGFTWPYRIWLEAKCVRGEFNFRYIVFVSSNVGFL